MTQRFSGEGRTTGPKQATALAKRLSGLGFRALGGFHPEPGDDCPPAVGGPARTVLLIGNAGPDLWHRFIGSEEVRDGHPDPLDRYTRRTLTEIADAFALSVAFPFERPYQPFQRWALKAGGFSQSPLGVLAHHRYGPWAAFRAAFLSAERFGQFEENGTPGPCEACAEQPCMRTCPVEAIGGDGYDVPRCREHLATPAGRTCLDGCLARISCPYGTTYRQAPDQARFHMRAFVGWNTDER